jgi:hypothetical protein
MKGTNIIYIVERKRWTLGVTYFGAGIGILKIFVFQAMIRITKVRGLVSCMGCTSI